MRRISMFGIALVAICVSNALFGQQRGGDFALSARKTISMQSDFEVKAGYVHFEGVECDGAFDGNSSQTANFAQSVNSIFKSNLSW